MAFLALVSASCGGDSGGSSGVPSTPSTPPSTSTAVTGVTISKSSLTLIEGTSETVTATVNPSTAKNKTVFWSSSDSNIASVDNEGKITAKKPGKVTITVTTADGNKTATLTLAVDLDYITRQKAVLAKLYESLNGDSWTNKIGWNTDAELKDWFGIQMNGNKIISINLKANNLKGKLPESIGEQLAVTKALIAQANTRVEEEATTRAEEHVSILGGLQSLDLSANQISGSIPQTIGNLNNLTELNLSNNSFTGSIPQTVGNLTNLTALDLSSNSISGSIPPEVGNLSNLSTLDLSDNSISGSIPETVGGLTNLKDLDLSNNNLTGGLPTTIVNLENLETLSVENNQLTETVSDDIKNSDMWKNLDETPDLSQKGGGSIDTEVTPTTPSTPTTPTTPTTPETPTTPTTISVTGVNLNKSTLDLIVGGSEALTATVAPADATNKAVSWSSNKTSVATVDANGKVTAVSAGTATITAKTIDGGKTATCSVTVKEQDPTSMNGNATHEGYGIVFKKPNI